MYLKLKNILFANIILKTASFIIGCICWYLISQSHTTTMWVDVPLCFYGNIHQYQIDAPSSIAVNVRGKRSDLCALDMDTLAAHINVRNLPLGTTPLVLSAAHLFLPAHVNVVHSNPLHTTITLNNNHDTHSTVAQTAQGIA